MLAPCVNRSTAILWLVHELESYPLQKNPRKNEHVGKYELSSVYHFTEDGGIQRALSTAHTYVSLDDASEDVDACTTEAL